MLAYDPEGRTGPSKPLPDSVVILQPSNFVQSVLQNSLLTWFSQRKRHPSPSQSRTRERRTSRRLPLSLRSPLRRLDRLLYQRDIVKLDSVSTELFGSFRGKLQERSGPEAQAMCNDTTVCGVVSAMSFAAILSFRRRVQRFERISGKGPIVLCIDATQRLPYCLRLI